MATPKSSGGGEVKNSNVGTVRPAAVVARSKKKKWGANSFDTVVTEDDDVVRSGQITPEEAESVYKDAMRTWGLAESSQSDRQKIERSLALCAAYSTSGSMANLSTRFSFGGSYFTIEPIVSGVMQISPQENPFRVWIRSYENCKLGILAYYMARDPANVELRTYLALKINAPISDAPYAIDVIDYVLPARAEVVTAEEIMMTNKYRAIRLSAAQDKAAQVGKVTTDADVKNQVRNSPTVVSGVGGEVSGTPGARLGLKDVRGLR